jgi:hypothetical protein
METKAQFLKYNAELSAILIHDDGTQEDRGIISGREFNFKQALKTFGKILGFSAAAYLMAHEPAHAVPLIVTPALITDAGLNFLAVAMTVDAAGTDFFNMKFHDSGTGTTAAAQTDTTLQTQAGPTTRATGVNTQTQSASGTGSTTPAIVQSVGTIAYTTTLAITEWGLFSQAAQGGTMWDHRIFSAINVVNGDSIQFTYSLSIPGGGT